MFKTLYDSVFEVIDNNTKTNLASDYVTLIKRIHSMVQRSLWYNHKDLFNNTSPSQATSKSFHKWMIKHIRDDFTASRPSHNMHKIISRGCSPSNLAINFHNLPSQSYRLDIGSRTRTRPRRRCRTRTRN